MGEGKGGGVEGWGWKGLGQVFGKRKQKKIAKNRIKNNL